MVKPLVPYITDTISHAFWFAEHLKTVHHQHGSDHVHYEIAAETKKNNPDKNPGAAKKDNTENECLIVEKHDPNTIFFFRSDIAIAAVSDPAEGFVGCDYLPPRI